VDTDWLNLASALGIGLLIGVERKRHGCCCAEVGCHGGVSMNTGVLCAVVSDARAIAGKRVACMG